MKSPTGTVARRLGLGLAVAASLLAAAGALAAGDHTVTIGAVILSNSNCRFNTASPSTLAFGNIDPSSTTDASASLVLNYRCNGGDPIVVWSVSGNNGLYPAAGMRRLRHTNTVNFLPYSLNLPLNGVTPRNTNQNLTLTGTIAVADFTIAIGGNYSDQVVLSIAP